MIRIDMTSPDIDRQILLLEEYPEIARKHFLPAVKMSVNILKALIRPTIPSPGRYGRGRARSDFQGKATGTTLQNIKGRVGFDNAWHMNIVEYGARQHPLSKGSTVRTRGGAARFASGQTASSKVPVFIKGVGWRKMDVHPGFGGRFFLKAGYEKGRSLVERELAVANERVAKELTV